jgi:O-antigen ligase
MPKRRSHKRDREAASGGGEAPRPDVGELVRRGCLASTVGLLVATPLVPSEAAVELGSSVVLLMLWLLVLVIWLGTLACRPAAGCRFGVVDAALLVFLALHTLSAVVMARYGHGRPTVNALWQWVGFGVCCFLLRQLLRSAAEIRAVLVVMVALAVGLSVFAGYQYFHTLPQLRAEYQRDPERALRQAGVDATPGAPERKLFEDRLRSTEPIATFALTNSLAGFLVPWLLTAVGIGALGWRHDSRARRITPIAGVAVAVAGFCLLLTKSRTAFLAVGLGLFGMAVFRLRAGRRIGWQVPVIGGVAALLLLGGAIAAGAFDRLVLSEAPKSVLYRLQYWRSTLAMIADYPWLGCGPGNFQQYYSAYKLPEASETVADPHNFLLEVWATAGTPAMIAWVALLALWAWRLWRGPQSSAAAPAASEQPPLGEPGAVTASAWRWVYAGALCGAPVAVPAAAIAGMSLDGSLLWTAWPVMALCVAGLHPWVAHGQLPVGLPAVAAGALLVNLLAAGGIGFPGVAQNWWLLLAISLNLVTRPSLGRIIRPISAGAMLLAAVLLAVVYHQTMYQPVLGRQVRMAEGGRAWEQRAVSRAEESFRAAAVADPFSGEPWEQLAALYHQQILAAKDPATAGEWLRRFDPAVEQLLRLDKRSLRQARQVGDWRLSLYRARNDARQIELAVNAYATWVRFCPNSNLAHAQLAWTLRLTGRDRQAAAEAEKALHLDQRCPHREKKLSEQRVFDPARESSAHENAEQLMQGLRNLGDRRGMDGSVDQRGGDC